MSRRSSIFKMEEDTDFSFLPQDHAGNTTEFFHELDDLSEIQLQTPINSPQNQFTIPKVSFTKTYKKTAVTAFLLMISWFTSSLGLSVYNKWLFSKNHFNFPYPLFTTCSHNIIQFCLSWFVLQIFLPNLKPTAKLSFKEYLKNVFPAGLATGLDIGFSNASFRFITLTFYTMVKSGAPVFVLLFAFLFKLEKINCKLIICIGVICFGVLLMVTDKTNFNINGYLLVQAATILSGLRWALIQILLKNSDLGMTNPFATNLYLTPIMAVTLLISSIMAEGLYTIFSSHFFQSITSILTILGVIFFGGVLAFIMLLVEYQLISTTSVVTFSIAGILKEVLTISTSHIVFQDSFSFTAAVGLIVSIVGIAAYNYIRINDLYQKHQSEVIELEENQAFISTNNFLTNDITPAGEEEEELLIYKTEN
ncbi:Triose-phosphate Transporter [Clydaea vesicula]|uniref:Triose-phosphate Transporter n=1 Tax=Clydaea vesicula TaxID=447962 RepID=A0AAD5Y1M1_9FUNG|nr:Triose-phosphate Transporter [Clydaea vesicula]